MRKFLSSPVLLLSGFVVSSYAFVAVGPNAAQSVGLLGQETSTAQEVSPTPSALAVRPVRNAIQEVAYDWASQSWAPSSSVNSDSSAAVTTVYANIPGGCPFFGVYQGLAPDCEVLYDSGRIPSPSDPNAPVGATTDNLITSFEINYCTYEATPDITIAFYESHDACDGVPTATLASFTPIGLPGSAASNIQACYQVTVDISSNPFTIKSDGDGTFDGSPSLDNFSWSFALNSGTAPFPTGPIGAGDPPNAPVGDCTYANPCTACGATGLGKENKYFIEQTSLGCGSLPTGCYVSGVWGFHLQMERTDAAPPTTYCTAGTSTSLCQADLSATGTPSATATSGFTLTASTLEGDKDGLFFFASNGQQANSWGSGTSFQCVVPPVKRGGLLAGSGTPGLCDGSTAQDLNALWCPTCPKPLKNPGAGAVTQAQFWYRDPFNTSNQTTSLSDAIEFTVGP